jgi:hypothetical protein
MTAPMTSREELLPCPFCGGQPIWRGEFLECGDCSAQGPTNCEAATGWNSRTDAQSLNKINDAALAIAIQKIRKLRLLDYVPIKDSPPPAVSFLAVMKSSLGGSYEDGALEYIFRHFLKYYNSAMTPERVVAWREDRCKCSQPDACMEAGWCLEKNSALTSAQRGSE